MIYFTNAKKAIMFGAQKTMPKAIFMIDFVSQNLLWSQGHALLGITFLAALIAWFWYPRALFVVAGFFLFFLYFFRNPERTCPEALIDSSVIVSPADGKVVEILRDENNNLHGYAQRISIFLSPFDVHVNRLPISGTIQKISYVRGQFMPAFLPKSSELNEHNDVTISNEHTTVMVRQIAGTVARRIVWWIHEGDSLKAGDLFGMIKFGSRVDLFLPTDATVNVAVGDRVVGGQTVIGRTHGS